MRSWVTSQSPNTEQKNIQVPPRSTPCTILVRSRGFQLPSVHSSTETLIHSVCLSRFYNTYFFPGSVLACRQSYVCDPRSLGCAHNVARYKGTSWRLGSVLGIWVLDNEGLDSVSQEACIPGGWRKKKEPTGQKVEWPCTGPRLLANRCQLSIILCTSYSWY